MIRVLNVVFDERVGGPQLRVIQVAGKLLERGIQTVVVAPRGDPLFGLRLSQANIAHAEFDLVRPRFSADPRLHVRFLSHFWPNVNHLRAVIRGREIDIVHTNGLMNLQAAVAARLEHVPLVWHLNDTNTPRPLRSAILPLVLRWASQIAIAAEAVGGYYFRDLSAPNGKVQTLYAPVDTNRFAPGNDGWAVRSEIGIAPDAVVIGAVGNLSPGKGHEFFIQAAAAILHRCPNVRFLIVGSPLANRKSYEERLRNQVRQLGLEQRVFFLGRREDMPSVMAAMNIYVHPSEAEACPMAVLEASASGLPVVATDVGGTRELVDHGRTGLLMGSRAPSQIAGHVIQLLENPEQARQMGWNGAKKMLQRFSLEQCVERHVRIYSAALNVGLADRHTSLSEFQRRSREAVREEK